MTAEVQARFGEDWKQAVLKGHGNTLAELLWGIEIKDKLDLDDNQEDIPSKWE